MSSKPPKSKSDRIRHRIKDIELQPIRSSKYPIGVKLFIDDQEVCELARIGKGRDLRWSRPIVCNVLPESRVVLEIREIHTVKDQTFKSQAYVISDVQNRTDTTIGFPGTQWNARLTLLTPAAVEQSHDDALKQLKEAGLTPSAVERLSKARSILENVLEFGGAVAEAHPTAKLVFSVCTAAWTKLKEEEQLKEDTQQLIDGLAGIVELARIVKDHTDMERLKDTTENILILLEDIFIWVLERESRGGGGVVQKARRLVDSSDRDKVKELLSRFEGLRETFKLEIDVEIHKRQREQEVRQLLDQLQPVESADYNSKPPCQDGTRVQIIDDITNWTEQRPGATTNCRPLLWIYGQAGIGKSSIASSVCRGLEDAKALAASFFCKRRGGSELQDPLRLINTVAHGLASRCHEYGQAVTASIKNDGKLCKTSLIVKRYEGLLDKPLKGLKDLLVPRPLIVLVDALDECGTREGRDQLLKCLQLLSGCVPWLKVIITSRPDGDITEFFDKLGDEHFISRNVQEFDASDDIRAYFEKELGNLAGKRRWEWPEGSVNRLCDKAGGLFIWASTARLHIGCPVGFDVAVQRFNVVLEGQGSAVSDLDKLYEKVIEDGMRDTRDDNREVFCQYVGALIVTSTRKPLSLADLCSLLLGQLDCGTLEYVIERLRSVLHVDEQMGGVLRFYHQSFVDYVTDQSRSGRFYVNPQERNTELARSCLNTMKLGLKFNICGLETSSLFNHQVHNFTERVQSKINCELSYSCLYWISHLTSTPNRTLQEELNALLDGPRVLYWLEALSLLAGLDLGMTGLLELLDWLPAALANTHECVMDLYRFTSTFFDAISASTPHLYVSALALAPESALIVRRLRSHFPGTVSITSGGDKSWPDWLRTLTHPEKVLSLAISSDGRHLVTGCADNMVRLWNINTGAQVGEPLAGHSDAVSSVAFSPSGVHIVSGSKDKSVRVWDSKTHVPVGEPLVGLTDQVMSVAFSPNGNIIASGSSDNTVRMWDAKTQALIDQPLIGHSSSVSSLAFSSSSSIIVSGSLDATVRIWDAQTYAPIGEPLVGHSGPVWCVAISPNGNLIASGSSDKTVRIWDAKCRVPIGDPLVGHSSTVNSVAFSPNGDLIASGSRDKALRMWDAQTHAAVGEPLLGHSGGLKSIAFSPDGNFIVSGSLDNTVRVWDVRSRATITEKLDGHSSAVTSVAFSPSSDTIVSGSHDQTLRVWDVETYRAIGEPLRGHSGWLKSIAFSPKEDLLVSGSFDHTLRIWDVKARAQVGEPLTRHSSEVMSVAFSPKGDFIVSGSTDKTLRVWDVNTHATIGEPLIGHADRVTSVAFSPNGDLIASGSADKSVRLWDAQTRTPVGEPLSGHTNGVTSVAFSPKGDLIASASADNTVRLWDVNTHVSVGELVGHVHWVTSIAFSPNGNLVVSGSWDKTLRIWDVNTRATVGEPFVGHTNWVTSVAFSSNGELIVSGSADHTVRVWKSSPQGSELSASSHSPLPSTTFGLPPLGKHDGWVSLDKKSLLLWLPIRYRRQYDPRAIYSISADPALSTISLDFWKFVYGRSWASVASGL